MMANQKLRLIDMKNKQNSKRSKISPTTEAFKLFETLSEHPDIWGCHYGLICQNGKYEAICIVGEEEKSCTQYGDFCEPQEKPIEAALLAIKDTVKGLQEIIDGEIYDPEQRENCRELYQAIQAVLNDHHNPQP